MDLEEKLFREGLIPSSLGKRAGAMIIDQVIVSLILAVSFWEQFQSAAGNMERLILISQSIMPYAFVLLLMYQTFFVFMYGKTVGKIVMRIRIVDVYTLDKPSLFFAFMRAMVRTIGEALFFVTMAYAIVDPFRRTLHDLVAKVVVVDD